MAEHWHRAEKCKTCYYCRPLSNSTAHGKNYLSDNWDGNICYYSLDTNLVRIGKGETCECCITVDEMLNKPNSQLKQKIVKMLKLGKSILCIKRDTQIPEKYIRAVAKEIGVTITESSMFDMLLEDAE